ncbi:DUF4153 domain-containing protein [Salmonirosea aquatica]|uniref:DUF4153 domain-containing protein n=1 Tax=Salmonirosea aquatica TaxID=2654236 RepID=A0A7C9BFY6_9BACT|nr:DUF4153 domain-containing protein [Cytophagaceae bacterium SJW1-29]
MADRSRFPTILRIPSLKTLTYGIEQVVRRFPLVVLVAALKAYLLYRLISLPDHFAFARPMYIRPLLVVFVALPLLLSLHLVAERRKWSRLWLAAGALGLLALLVAYFFTISPVPIQRDYYRFGMFLVSAHLVVSFAPFVGYDEPNGFWRFNKTMLLQFLTATLYAGTLYIGVLVAVETVRFLFSFDFSYKVELYLLVFIGGFLHSLFFLNGFPAHLENLEAQKGYSAGVKLFTQYVLLPLEVVYLLILYVYTAKILVQWQLPQGGVAYLVMAFSVAGIFALLLLYPIRDSAEERWIRIFTNRFHLALFPLIVLLGVAIFRRISEYGVTENRYLVAALAVWLTGLTLYFLISKKDDIRWIPLSLCVASFLLAVGPWSIFSYSRQNQAKRFGGLLEKYKLLDSSGKLTGKATLPADDYDRLISGIRYFRDRKEIGTLSPFFASVPEDKNQSAIAGIMEKQLRETVSAKTRKSGQADNIRYALAGGDGMYGTRIQGYDYLLVFDLYGDAVREQDTWKVEAAEQGARLIVSKNERVITTLDIAARVAQIEQQYGAAGYEVSPDELTFTQAKVRVSLNTVSKSGKLYSYRGVLLGKD